MLKWKEEFLNQIKSSSNEELLWECLSAAGGDDYDGCFTKRGEWMYGELQVELQRRLKEGEISDSNSGGSTNKIN